MQRRSRLGDQELPDISEKDLSLLPLVSTADDCAGRILDDCARMATLSVPLMAFNKWQDVFFCDREAIVCNVADEGPMGKGSLSFADCLFWRGVWDVKFGCISSLYCM